MLTSLEPNLLIGQYLAKAIIHFISADIEDRDAVLEKLGERFHQGVEELAESLVDKATPFLTSVAADLKAMGQRMEAAPRILGHERLLMETLGYHPLWARIVTHQLHRWGELLAEEIRVGRRMRTLIDRIAKAQGRGTLVMSRRAKMFRNECSNNVEARNLIDRAAEQFGVSSRGFM